MQKNVNFIFGLLDKKKIGLCLLIEAVLDFLYYVIPFTFALFLTLPFTIKKAIAVAAIFIVSKTFRCFVLWLHRKIMDNYLYEYANLERLEFYKKLTQVPVEVLSKYQTGYLESLIGKIIDLVKEILSAEYIGIFLSFGFFFYTVFNQSVMLFIISVIVSIICVLVSIKVLRKSKTTVEDLYEKEYEYSSIYQDFISNIRTVKVLNSDEYFENIIKKEGNKCFNQQKRYVKYYSLEELLRNVLIVIPFILAIIKAVYDLANGIDTLGIITFYISIYLEMGYIFDELSGTIVNVFELKALYKKCCQLFRNLDNKVLVRNFSSISLKDVEIKYQESGFSISVPSLVIENKDKISITGKSGQGKTSVVNLLLGNISTYQGEVLIDKYNLKDIDLDIGVVSQEIELFNMSLKDNLCLNSKISENKLIQYIEELELNDLLMFEDGLNTVVGKRV